MILLVNSKGRKQMKIKLPANADVRVYCDHVVMNKNDIA